MAHIGIIVFSQTGNTLSVARGLQDKLEQDGHTVALAQVRADSPENGRITLLEAPPVASCDNLVFASPVQAFSLARAMQLYLEQLPELTGKKIACLVTKQLPWNWTGGNRALRQMQHACRGKGAVVSGTAIVHWRPEQREQETRAAIETLSGLFAGQSS